MFQDETLNHKFRGSGLSGKILDGKQRVESQGKLLEIGQVLLFSDDTSVHFVINHQGIYLFFCCLRHLPTCALYFTILKND